MKNNGTFQYELNKNSKIQRFKVQKFKDFSLICAIHPKISFNLPAFYPHD
jgi:hypothetical protein